MQVTRSRELKASVTYQQQTTPEMFIIKALEKILADREIKKSYNSQIKKACESALGSFSFT